MWTGGSQRIKALIAAKDRELARLSLPIHANRADVKIVLVTESGERKEIAARALLTDFKPKGTYIYSHERLPPNLEVLFEIEHPDSFRIVGKVIWCQYQPSSARVISEQSFQYRLGLGFHFLNPADENRFSDFCTRLQDGYVSPRVLFDKSPDILERIGDLGDDEDAILAAFEKTAGKAARDNVVELRSKPSMAGTVTSEADLRAQSAEFGGVDLAAMMQMETSGESPEEATTPNDLDAASAADAAATTIEANSAPTASLSPEVAAAPAADASGGTIDSDIDALLAQVEQEKKAA